MSTVDRKHQVIIDAQAFGEGQEHHTLQPILESIQDRYQRLNLSPDIFQAGVTITADTGFANEANNHYLYENDINGYIPDNQFRRRDLKFADQKSRRGKRQPDRQSKTGGFFPPTAFHFDPVKLACICPAGERLGLRREADTIFGHFPGNIFRCN